MNRAILYIAQSLDGFVAGRNDDISWLFRYNDVDYGFDEFFSRIGAVIKGRRTYDIEIQHGWENAAGSARIWPRVRRRQAQHAIIAPVLSASER